VRDKAYRWSEECQRWETWDDSEGRWTVSCAYDGLGARWADAIAIEDGMVVLLFEDTWCEPCDWPAPAPARSLEQARGAAMVRWEPRELNFDHDR
jgi:hypothetical protein